MDFSSSRHIRMTRPLRSSLATMQTGSGRYPLAAINSKSTAQISRKDSSASGPPAAFSEPLAAAVLLIPGRGAS